MQGILRLLRRNASRNDNFHRFGEFTLSLPKCNDICGQCFTRTDVIGDIMYILGVDFETTGLAESKDTITEIGAVLWDWENKKPALLMSELIAIPENVSLNQVVVEMNGITEQLLAEFGSEPAAALNRLNKMGEKADYIMAHNAEFDKRFYVSSTELAGVVPLLCGKLWLDSAADVEYPKNISVRKLTFLAAEHNFLNPFKHRAVFDVLTMFRVVQGYKIERIIRSATEPKYELKAKVPFDSRQRAKERSFRWDDKNMEWVKTVKESMLKKELKCCNFEVYFRKKDSDEEWRKE